MTSQQQVIGLYRQLQRAGRGFTNYNFREYALRRIREGFNENRSLSDAGAITAAYQQGRVELEMLKRQSSISQMFPQEKHAMESPAP